MVNISELLIAHRDQFGFVIFSSISHYYLKKVLQCKNISDFKRVVKL